MKKILLINFFMLSNLLFSVEIVVDPYLQNATPNSIKILWETDSNSISQVEWGLQLDLSNSNDGDSFNNYGSSKIHTVELTGLEPNTRYYYRVVIGEDNQFNYSDICSFITPPNPVSENPFTLIAMSDMQRDNSNPNKFYEIVHDGIIDYILDQHSDDLADELALVFDQDILNKKVGFKDKDYTNKN